SSAKVAEIPRALDDLVVKLMAKNPNDRPWDAAAVSETLKSILEKAGRGESVPMVWATDSAVDPMAQTRSAERPRKPKKSRGSSTFAGEIQDRKVFLLETAGLVLALLALGSFVGYMLWPPSARYLYTQAERLMASGDRHKWDEAIEEYL